MAPIPSLVAEFLGRSRIAVAGVSRDAGQPANAIFRRLRDSGHEVVPINPQAREVERVPCYPDLASIPGTVEGVMIATHPDVSVEIARQSAARGVDLVWFHRSFGGGSVSPAAVEACRTSGIRCIVGGCPLMYCEPVDVAHRCMRWWLRWRGRVPR
jgi:hypothetical protein